MAIEKKYIGDSTLLEQPKKKLGFKLKDGSVVQAKIANGAVSLEKLDDEVRQRLEEMIPLISLGFYTDENPPSPIVMLAVRPAYIDETIIPYLLLGQTDSSDKVTDWKWERISYDTEGDNVWNNSPKATRRRLELTTNDFPVGWNLEGNKLSFRCTATFYYEGAPQILINVVNCI